MAKLNMLLFTAFMALLGMVFGDFCNGGVARTATFDNIKTSTKLATEIMNQLSAEFTDGYLKYVGLPVFDFGDSGNLYDAVPSKPNVIMHADGDGAEGSDPNPLAGKITPANGANLFSLNSAKGACISQTAAVDGSNDVFKACTINFKCTSNSGGTYSGMIKFEPASKSSATYVTQNFADLTYLVSCEVSVKSTLLADLDPTIVLLDDINYTPLCGCAEVYPGDWRNG